MHFHARLFLLVSAFSLSAFAADEEKRFDFHGYSTINYYHFDWETDPDRRDAVDLERMALEFDYHVSPRMLVESEIEFEHGGTGTTMELDKLDEFGEYETEIEKGGEVKVEELSLSFLLHPMFNIKVGHFFVPIGFAPVLDEPVDYFTVERSEAEQSMIPVLWDETGVEIFGDLPGVRYQLQVVNGLDATGFSSATWVARGHQGRFETINAENMAVAGRLDATGIPFVKVGVSGYFGDSRDNRPKPDLLSSAYVGILSGHAQWSYGPFVARGLVMWGWLTNSEAVTQRNSVLDNNFEAPRTPVAAEAYASFVEAGVDALRLAGARTQSGVLFGRVDSYDTMRKTEGDVLNNPRWEHLTLSGGVNYKPHPQVVLKGQYAHRTDGNDRADDTYSLGLGIVVF